MPAIIGSAKDHSALEGLDRNMFKRDSSFRPSTMGTNL